MRWILATLIVLGGVTLCDANFSMIQWNGGGGSSNFLTDNPGTNILTDNSGTVLLLAQ